jgi:hypothetical protein
MKVSIRINKDKLSKELKINSGTIVVRFKKVTHHGSGMLATELARQLVEGYTEEVRKRQVSIPPRPLFREYAENNLGTIKSIVISSLRFKKIDSDTRFSLASKQLANNVAQWVIAGNVTPANSRYTQRIKGFNAPFYSTGELVSLLEGVYVHKS